MSTTEFLNEVKKLKPVHYCVICSKKIRNIIRIELKLLILSRKQAKTYIWVIKMYYWICATLKNDSAYNHQEGFEFLKKNVIHPMIKIFLLVVRKT